MLDWLLAPIDPARVHVIPEALAWHARLMVAAWGILVPCGILVARFLKLWPGQAWPERLDHPGWWHLHRLFQYLAGLMTVAGLTLVLTLDGRSAAGTTHRLIGWTLVGLAALQFAAAWLRGSKGGPTAPAPDGSWRGDHYDMTPRRIAFEYLHKFGGYAAAFVAMSAILTGLWQANGPRWMWIVLGLWWALCTISFVIMQRRGMAFDTYQAHWGSDTLHPGNRRRPVGFGIRRVPPTTLP